MKISAEQATAPASGAKDQALPATEAYVLMYHRVCERSPMTACWFERGTAVTPEHFEAQIDWLEKRVRFVLLDEALASVGSPPARDGRPACAITFDDGYRDAAIAITRRLPVTIFAVVDPSLDPGASLWFDRYYSILHHACVREQISAESLGLPEGTAVPAIDNDLRWWVRGPVKMSLQTVDPAARTKRLDRLAEVLEADETGRGLGLYLQRDELRHLVSSGHRVGGHGTSHSRLTQLDDELVASELAESRAFVDSLGPQPFRLFCYPDGAYDERIKRAVERASFDMACCVDEGVVTAASDRHSLPRLFMRDVAPQGADWPSALSRLKSGVCPI